MNALDLLSAALAMAGAGFFLAGTVGLLRFPDVFCRLHALTKADNAGLGLLVVALAVHGRSLRTAAELLLVWALALLASSGVCALFAASALRDEHRRRGGDA